MVTVSRETECLIVVESKRREEMMGQANHQRSREGEDVCLSRLVSQPCWSIAFFRFCLLSMEKTVEQSERERDDVDGVLGRLLEL